MDDSPLSRALEILTLADVWELAPDNSEAPRRDGLRHSPFRQDKKPSWSVFGGLRRYKDQASDEKAGGVWTFVQACRPEWEKKEIAHYLVDRAGLEWKEQGPQEQKSVWKRRAEREERKRAAKAKAHKELRQITIERIQMPDAWPKCVAEHWHSNNDDELRIKSLAKRRGWPLGWVELLYETGHVRWPTLPWSDRHFPAFPVVRPDGIIIGYHQRIWTEQDGPSWLYVPYAPKKVFNDFTRSLRDFALCKEGRLVPPLPFYMGWPKDASLWIICEGQWDAITIWGLLGGFDDTFELPVAVFGLRGASAGPGTFLGAYEGMLRHQRPYIWLMPDNDRAGCQWDGRGLERSYGHMRRITFAEILRQLTGENRSIPVSRVPRHHGKDFNDYFKSANPTRESLLTELERLFPSWLQNLNH